MKKIILILVIFILAITACSTTKTIKISDNQNTQQQTQPQSTEHSAQVATVDLAPDFKLIRQYGVRSPATISGTVRNVGLGTGTVKVTANVYYGGVISSAGTQELTIKPEEEGNFSISIDKTAQWTSYSVKLEQVK